MPDDGQVPQQQQQQPERQKVQVAPVIDTSEFSVLLDSSRFAQIQRVATLFAESDLVPDVFHNKVANCAVALQMAFRLQIDPMMLMQNMYIVYGRPGIEAKLAIALINSRGPFNGPLQWRTSGTIEDGTRAWTCYATHRATSKECAATVDWKLVLAEGWDKARGTGDRKQPSKWTTMPEIMGMYRSAMFLGRLYCPEVLLGLPTRDEMEDTGEQTVVGTRLDEGVELMPRAVEPPRQPPGMVIPPAARSVADAPTQTKADEPKRPAEQAQPAFALEPEKAGPAPTPDGPPPPQPKSNLGAGADAIDQAVQTDPMAAKRIASKTQRDMIAGIAEKHAGLTAEQLDEKLADKFACNLATLPMMMVNDAIAFVRTLRAA